MPVRQCLATWLASLSTIALLCDSTHTRVGGLPSGLRASLTKLVHEDPGGFAGDLASALLTAPYDIHAKQKGYTCPLNESAEINIYPISFALPDHMFVPVVPAKSQDFSKVVPGMAETYAFIRSWPQNTPQEILAAEEEYYSDISRSLFSFTFKKSGWDCLRHLEIVAAGTLPIFTDIDEIPDGTMATHPLGVYKLLKNWPGLIVHGMPGTSSGLSVHASLIYNSSRDSKSFLQWTGPVKYNLKAPINRELYQLAVESLLHICKTVLTSSAVAKHVMTVTNMPLESRVLWITDDNDMADYQCDTLLHGFVTLMSTNVVDYPRRKCMWRNTETFTEADLAQDMLHEYGKGFGYAHKLYETPGMDRSNIEERITSGMFDFVVIGIASRAWWRTLAPLVCSSLPKNKVIFIFGNDGPPSKDALQECSACSSFIFAREMPNGCHQNVFHKLTQFD